MNAQLQPRQCTCELCWPDVDKDPTPVNAEQDEQPVTPVSEDAEATVAMAV